MGLIDEKLNSQHQDAFREISNISVGNALIVLSNMMNELVSLGIPRVELLELPQIPFVLGGAQKLVIAALISLSGDLNGYTMIAFRLRAATILTNTLLRRDRGTTDLDKMELSTIQEIINILNGAYLSTISEMTGLTIYASAPMLATDMAGAILNLPAIEIGKTSDSSIFIATDFDVENTAFSGNFLFAPTGNSHRVLLEALGM